ncbi:MAG: hypothetical protein IPM82_05575 [Saprospiraceae bacterium]|nr:hypothetical protein [Saprospiraceae bacterium]
MDIITYKIFPKKSPITAMDGLKSETELLHEVEKAFFFNVLKPEYLATLNPQYQ